MKIAVIMGSNSDYTTMIETCKLLDEFEIPYDKKLLVHIEHRIYLLNFLRMLEEMDTV